MLNYDILVVGTGPAGSSAALEAAKGGAKVLLIEKKRTIGEPVQCAEFIPKLLLNKSEISPNSIVQEIRIMRTYLPSGECFESNSPGYMLNRSLFDKELAMKAADRGADILTNTLCISKKGEKIIINKNGRRKEVIPKVIIGADGPKSTVGKWINSINKDFIIGLQYEVPLTAPQDFTEIYFDHDIFGGYGWLFPKRGSANVGVGIRYSLESKTSKLLDGLLKRVLSKLESEDKIKNSPISTTGGLIPVGGPLCTVKNNIMLVGDAAGQTHPITGSGISQAIICGKIAGKTAVRSIRENNRDILNSYKNEWREIFGEWLEIAYNRRQLLENSWDNLDTILKKCWVTFREYYYE